MMPGCIRPSKEARTRVPTANRSGSPDPDDTSVSWCSFCIHAYTRADVFTELSNARTRTHYFAEIHTCISSHTSPHTSTHTSPHASPCTLALALRSHAWWSFHRMWCIGTVVTLKSKKQISAVALFRSTDRTTQISHSPPELSLASHTVPGTKHA